MVSEASGQRFSKPEPVPVWGNNGLSVPPGMTNAGGWRVGLMNQIVTLAELGVVTREKLIANQVDADAIAYRAREGSLIAVQRGVYRLRGAPDSFEARALAACLYAGEEAAVSHRAAAYLHRLEGYTEPENVEVLLPARVKARLSGVLVHRTLEPFQSVSLQGIRTTSLPRTLIDLADQLSFDELEKVLNAAWRTNRNIIPWLKQEIAKLKRKKWSGLDKVSQLVRRMDGRGLDSDLELEVLKEIERRALPKPTKGLVILDGQGRYVIRGDLGWEKWKTVLHCDSVTWHGTEQAMVRDAFQRSELSLLKWTQISVMKRTLEDGVWLRQLERALAPI